MDSIRVRVIAGTGSWIWVNRLRALVLEIDDRSGADPVGSPCSDNQMSAVAYQIALGAVAVKVADRSFCPNRYKSNQRNDAVGAPGFSHRDSTSLYFRDAGLRSTTPAATSVLRYR
jgi:hypothetical protein